MPEKQNEDNVTLGSIWGEIKSMRKEAEIRHKQALTFSGMCVTAGMCSMGIGVYVTSEKLSVEWWQGAIIMVVCFVSFYILFAKLGKLRKERREMHKETENG